LQIKESCSNQEEQDSQGLSNLQLEHQEDLPSPYEYVASNYDKELDACYESAAQKSNKDIFSFGISCKDIIVEEEIVSCDKLAYHHDEFRLHEGEQKDSDQLLSFHFYQTKVEQSTFNINISEAT